MTTATKDQEMARVGATSVTKTRSVAARRVEATPAVLVWIDSREAVIVTIVDHDASVQRVWSDVPAHHRSTGHMRHDPSTRHGGGGDATAGEPRRLEHLEAFCKRVASRIPTTMDVVVLGPGTVRHHLEHRLREGGGPVPTRRVEALAAGRMSDHQLIAWLRRYMDEEPRRSTVGAYRWTGVPQLEASGHPVFTPRRTFVKRTQQGEDARG